MDATSPINKNIFWPCLREFAYSPTRPIVRKASVTHNRTCLPTVKPMPKEEKRDASAGTHAGQVTLPTTAPKVLVPLNQPDFIFYAPLQQDISYHRNHKTRNNSS